MRIGPIISMLVLTSLVVYAAITYGPGVGEWISDPQTREAIGGQAGNALLIMGASTIGLLGGLSIVALFKYLREK